MLFDFGSLNAKKRSAQRLNDASKVSFKKVENDIIMNATKLTDNHRLPVKQQLECLIYIVDGIMSDICSLTLPEYIINEEESSALYDAETCLEDFTMTLYDKIKEIQELESELNCNLE